VHHCCENKMCVNPEHLEAKPEGDHVRHHHLGVRRAFECPRGHSLQGVEPGRKCPVCDRIAHRKDFGGSYDGPERVRISPVGLEVAAEIRAKASGGQTTMDLVRDYGISKSVINCIRRGAGRFSVLMEENPEKRGTP
jgi:hypothetical protein